MEKFKVIEKLEAAIDFNFEYGNKEKIYRYLINFDDNRIIECMTIIHLNDNEPIDVTIEISNMYNCIVGCRFCASGSLPESRTFLKAEDYLKQVEICIKESNINLNDYPKLYVAFTGIGEPSVVKEEVAKGIMLIKERYDNVEVNIATTGFDNKCFEYWNKLNLPIRYFQLPYYSCEKDKIKYIIQNAPKDYDLINNIKEAIKYRKNHNECRVKINYVVMEGINDSEKDVEKMIEYLKEFKDDIIIKVSYLNYTEKCKENNLHSPSQKEMHKILNRIKQAGYDCYLFGTENNTELGCGQLVQNYICDENSKSIRSQNFIRKKVMN